MPPLNPRLLSTSNYPRCTALIINMWILSDVTNASQPLDVFSTVFVTQTQAEVTCAVVMVTSHINILSAMFAITIIVTLDNFSTSPHYLITLVYIISDLIHVCVYLASVINSCYSGATMGLLFCRILDYLQYATAFIVFWAVLLAPLERYIFFIAPYKYVRLFNTKGTVIYLSIGVWIALLQTYYSDGYPYERPVFTSDCGTHEIVPWSKGVCIALLLTGVAVHSICFAKFYTFIRQKRMFTIPHAPKNICATYNKVPQRTLRTVMTISGTFWVYQVPLFLCMIVLCLVAPSGEYLTLGTLRSSNVRHPLAFFTVQVLSIAQNTNRPLITLIGLLFVYRKFRKASLSLLLKVKNKLI